MVLRYRDTLTQRTISLSARGRPVTMYVCGPTVYAPSHVGHGRTYLYFDLVRRYLADGGVPVRHLMNITDVEDKIDQRAQELDLSPQVLARREERRFFRDLEKLNVLPPTYAPRASDFVPSMVQLARRLERTGRVHSVGSGWFFRPPKRRGATNFAVARQIDRHLVLDPNDSTGPRLDPREFLVWRRQDPPNLSFDGPWGPGIPGWHLECYAMASRYLGIPVDLQGGGQDLIFPHHYAQNEIALVLTGHPFARGFLHTEFVLRDGTKMSKSVGNLIDLGEAVRSLGPDAVRWFLLSAPRTKPVEWNSYAAAAARRSWERVRSTVRDMLRPGIGSVPASSLERLADSMRTAIGHDLAVDRAFRLLEHWTESVARRARPGFRRGERSRALRAARRIQRLTGLAFE